MWLVVHVGKKQDQCRHIKHFVVLVHLHTAVALQPHIILHTKSFIKKLVVNIHTRSLQLIILCWNGKGKISVIVDDSYIVYSINKSWVIP